MMVKLPSGSLLTKAHQSKSIGLRFLSCIAKDVATLHPRRHHVELVLVHRSPVERENVRVTQAFPQKYLVAKPLRTIVSSCWDPKRSVDQENRYPCCFTSIVIGSEPQCLDRDLPSSPVPFPQVSISTCCEGYLFMRLEILVDQAGSWQPPKCTTQFPKHSERGAFEISSDARMLKDLYGIDLASTTLIARDRVRPTVGSIRSMRL